MITYFRPSWNIIFYTMFIGNSLVPIVQRTSHMQMHPPPFHVLSKLLARIKHNNLFCNSLIIFHGYFKSMQKWLIMVEAAEI